MAIRQLIMVEIPAESKRPSVFAPIDRLPKALRVKSTSKRRILTVDGFDRVQAQVDRVPQCLVSLLESKPKGGYSTIVKEAKPHSAPYEELLRRIRFR